MQSARSKRRRHNPHRLRESANGIADSGDKTSGTQERCQPCGLRSRGKGLLHEPRWRSIGMKRLIPFDTHMNYGPMRMAIYSSGIDVTVESDILDNMWGCYSEANRVILIDRRLTYTAKKMRAHTRTRPLAARRLPMRNARATYQIGGRAAPSRFAKIPSSRTNIRRSALAHSLGARPDHTNHHRLSAMPT